MIFKKINIMSLPCLNTSTGFPLHLEWNPFSSPCLKDLPLMPPTHLSNPIFNHLFPCLQHSIHTCLPFHLGTCQMHLNAGSFVQAFTLKCSSSGSWYGHLFLVIQVSAYVSNFLRENSPDYSGHSKSHHLVFFSAHHLLFLALFVWCTYSSVECEAP